jgi:hypothetical protein
MSSGNPFGYMFKDGSWFIKLLAGIGFFILSAIVAGILQAILRGVGIELIPLLGVGIVSAVGSIVTSALINGYEIDVTHNITHGREVPLPKWLDNFWDKVKNGVLLSIIEFIWFLPSYVLGAVAGLSVGSVPQFTGLGYNFMVGPETQLNPAAGILIALAGLWGLFMAFVLPVIVARFASSKQFGSAFEFGPIFSILGNNIGKYLIVVLLEILAVIIAFLGIIGLVVGIFFTIAWVALFVMPGIWGFAYRDALANMGQPLPEGGPVPPTTPLPPYEPTRPYEPVPPTQPSEPVPPREPLPPTDQTPTSEPLPPNEPPSETVPPAEPLPPSEPQPPSGTVPPTDNNPPA